MKSLNKVLLIGNLTRDPEIRYTAKGSAVADFSIALNRGFSNDAGERVEETTFVDIVAWNKSAELAREYFSKGRKVYVEGRLQLDTWEDKETRQPRQKMRVIAERLDFADAKPQQDTDTDTDSRSDSDDEPLSSSESESSQSRQGSWVKNRNDRAGQAPANARSQRARAHS